jgi:hypothetical protein
VLAVGVRGVCSRDDVCPERAVVCTFEHHENVQSIRKLVHFVRLGV